MINDIQFSEAAKILGCDVATVKAVNAVEARGRGFLDNGDVKILFEAHIFWRQLKAKGIDPAQHTKGNEDILYPKWQRGKYGPESIQHYRLERAIKIDREAALLSASWGAFQIMGFNFKAAGFANVEQFVAAMKTDEYSHLQAFLSYVQHEHLDDELRARNWAGFALGYNGAEYKGSPYTTDDDYDLKLLAAYRKFSK